MSDRQTVTAETLVQAIANGGEYELARQLGIKWTTAEHETMDELSYAIIREIASRITLPDTTTGTLNGQPTDNRVIWRDEMPEPKPLGD